MKNYIPTSEPGFNSYFSLQDTHLLSTLQELIEGKNEMNSKIRLLRYTILMDGTRGDCVMNH